MSNPLKLAFPGVATSYAIMRGQIAAAFALVLADADELQAIDLADDGTLYPAVVYDGTVFEYDDADGTTPHDPEAGCIVSQDGRRYKRAAAVTVDWFVLDVDRTEPPEEPAQGDRHFVATGATGAWAGHDGEIAVAGRRGWHFAAVGEGQILYSAEDENYFRMLPAGTLAEGLPPALSTGSVETKHLASPFGAVVQAAQTTPPVSPSDRVAYIVTSVATGAWTGQETKVAEWDAIAAAWTFLTPRTGDHVWDVAAGYIKVWSGSAWVRAVLAPEMVHVHTIRMYRVTPDNIPGGTSRMRMKTFPVTTTTGRGVVIDISRLEVRWNPNNNTVRKIDVTLYKDSEATPLASWDGVNMASGDTTYNEPRIGTAVAALNSQRIIDIAADGSAHDYHFDVQMSAGSSLDSLEFTLDAIIYTTPAPQTS